MIDQEQKSETIETLLRLIAGSLVVSAALVIPGSTELLKLFRKKTAKPIEQKVFDAALRQMTREKLMAWKEVNGTLTLRLTKNGQQRSIAYTLDSMALKQPTTWDSIWRIVIFDIPETKRQSRDMLRLKLKALGFKQLQKSMWITPLPCRNEVLFILNVLAVDPYVVFIETNHLETSPSNIPSFTS